MRANWARAEQNKDAGKSREGSEVPKHEATFSVTVGGQHREGPKAMKLEKQVVHPILPQAEGIYFS